ncbi:MAG TPA: TetR/AcrR family transcriptional regulator [Mycobacterium sp.]|nr:TetR/AcrR family transcriptional regulator [Mycobacterium sp.]
MKVNGQQTVPSAPRRTQAQRTAATRALLLAAGRELFATQGYAAVSTQVIVDAAGVTRGALYHQFGDKTGLFSEVYEQAEQDIVAAISARIAAAGPTDQLEAMRVGARLFLEECSAPGVQRIVLIDAPSVLGWQRWREVGEKYGLGVIEAMLAQAISDGVIPEQPLRPTAHVLLGALDEAALFVARADDADAALRQMYSVCDRMISGIAGT